MSRPGPSRTLRPRARPLLGAALALSVHVAATACSDGAAEASRSADAGGEPTATNDSPAVEYTGDCSSAKWADVTDACWSCLCETCAAELDACDGACYDVMLCSDEQGCLVRDDAEMSCELRCVTGVCSGPGLLGAATFDSCLLGAADTAAGQFRACEEICAFNYPGDVCERHPG